MVRLPRDVRSMLALPRLFWRQSQRQPLFGFLTDSPFELDEVHDWSKDVLAGETAPRDLFESEFARTVGPGHATTFASARMAFYAFLKAQGVGPGDEVVLPAFTCSVMPNAILRLGAIPVFSDIDADTLGSTAAGIDRVRTARTRAVVAQHSFGTPCDVLGIRNAIAGRDILLIEDCATSFGAMINGICVGNFGDSAIFSLDHSKPLNAISGGVLYSHHASMVNTVVDRVPAGDLDRAKVSSMLNQARLEAALADPFAYWKLALHGVARHLHSQFSGSPSPFLDDDFRVEASTAYPYPALLPAEMAFLALRQLSAWPSNLGARRRAHSAIAEVVSARTTRSSIPAQAVGGDGGQAPLRFVCTHDDATSFRSLIRPFIEVEGTWFTSPVVATSLPASAFGYISGSCPIAEYHHERIVNLPLPTSADSLQVLLGLLDSTLTKAQGL